MQKIIKYNVLKFKIACQCMKSGKSACMFRISQGFRCRQDRRYISAVKETDEENISCRRYKS